MTIHLVKKLMLNFTPHQNHVEDNQMQHIHTNDCYQNVNIVI
jgi:hypothetical protein